MMSTTTKKIDLTLLSNYSAMFKYEQIHSFQRAPDFNPWALQKYTKLKIGNYARNYLK